MKRSAFCEVLQEILKQNMFLTWNPAFKQLQTGNSFHEKDQSLRLWSGSTDSKTIGYQRTNPSVQFNLVIQSCPTLCESMNRTTPGLPVITNTQSLLKVMSIELVMPSNHLILCHTLLLLPLILLRIRVFSNDSTLHIRWPKYWSLSFNISPSKEHPGWISFRMDWLDLLAVQGTLKSLLQHHS